MSNLVTIKRNGTDITKYVDWSTLDITSVLTKEVGTCKFSILKTPASASSIPQLADDIAVYDPSGLYWGGVVTDTEPIIHKQSGGLILEYQITATDYGYLLNSNVVKKAYVQMDPADIVADLIATYAPPGFNATTYVQRGNFQIASISFNYEQLPKCIQAIATQIGWDWYVDANKNIHFYFAVNQSGSTETYYQAPFTLDETNGNIEVESMDVDYNITNLINAIYVIGGTYEKNVSEVDTYLTNGTQNAWSLQYNYTFDSLSIQLNGVPQTLGEDQVTDPSTVDCLYNTTGHFIYFVSGGVPTAPSSGQTITVSGQANIPILAYVQDTDSITKYGIYENSIIDSSILSVPEAQERGTAELLQFSHPVYDVKFNTLTPGLAIGQAITFNSALFGVTNYPLVIKRIEAMGYTPGVGGVNTACLKYQVECIGSNVMTFNDIMMTLLQENNANIIPSSSSVLEILLIISEALAIEETVLISGQSSPYYWGPVVSSIAGGGAYGTMSYGSIEYAGAETASDTTVYQPRWNFFKWS